MPIRTEYECDCGCGAKRQPSNRWWIAIPPADGKLRWTIQEWDDRVARKKGVLFLAGQACVHRMADRWMSQLFPHSGTPASTPVPEQSHHATEDPIPYPPTSPHLPAIKGILGPAGTSVMALSFPGESGPPAANPARTAHAETAERSFGSSRTAA